MKIRNGFVSNSSSSSFVMFCSKEAFYAAYKGLSDLTKKVIDELSMELPEKFYGKTIVKYTLFISDCELDIVDDIVAESLNIDADDDMREEIIDDIKQDILNTIDEFPNMVEEKAKELGEIIMDNYINI